MGDSINSSDELSWLVLIKFLWFDLEYKQRINLAGYDRNSILNLHNNEL